MEFCREHLKIENDEDIVKVRKAVKAFSEKISLKLVEQTKIITAASEIARNTLEHGGGGFVDIEIIEKLGMQGIKMTFRDEGDGIEDIELALKDGYSTGNGLGLGLGGAKRLVDEFYIDSQKGKGTTVILIKLKRM